jgi:hypothetical protein
MHKYNDYFNILVTLAKIQFTHDDEPTISCINQDKNIDNEVYYVCIKFPNLLDYDARHDYMRMITDNANTEFHFVYAFWNAQSTINVLVWIRNINWKAIYLYVLQ